ncbi:uncharacterized protein PRCAT00000745001 [Priceomyces carsonii]|uniref:uncharacterized protein n=1 Tax=Priceomyces carsonii TaxID=28549 RepID=UPI002EDA2ECB|nr:unnamed protein product [Priceomyces carsonii]
MAKSLRSKSKLRSKSLKRKGEFSKAVDERTRRLAEKLKQTDETQQHPEKSKVQEMELDQPKKISTSGWRDSRKQSFKRKKSTKKTLRF